MRVEEACRRLAINWSVRSVSYEHLDFNCGLITSPVQLITYVGQREGLGVRNYGDLLTQRPGIVSECDHSMIISTGLANRRREPSLLAGLALAVLEISGIRGDMAVYSRAVSYVI